MCELKLKESINKKRLVTQGDKPFVYKAAATYFPTLSGAVTSALKGLTSLFGMGRGGSPSLRPPITLCISSKGYTLFLKMTARDKSSKMSKLLKREAFGVLVLLGSIHHCTSTCSLSTWSSSTPLKNTHLEDGFALRCFQRLS